MRKESQGSVGNDIIIFQNRCKNEKKNSEYILLPKFNKVDQLLLELNSNLLVFYFNLVL